jgi:hypothetical protein
MRDDEADEADHARDRDRGAGGRAGGEEHRGPRAADVDAEVRRLVLAQREEVQAGGEDDERAHRSEHRHRAQHERAALLVADGADEPAQELDRLLGGDEELEQRDHRRRERVEHDADGGQAARRA